jgi:PAS domain S-box-containing protein
MFNAREAARLGGAARGGRYRAGSLARRMMALAAVIMLPTILLSAWAGVRYAGIAHKARRGEVLSEARALAASVDREFKNYDVILESLARAGPLQRGDFNAFRQDAAPLVASVPGATLEILRPDGSVLASSEALPAGAGPLSYEPGVSTVSDVDETAAGTPIVAVALPMLSGGQTAFVVRLVIPAQRLVDIIRAQNYREGWFASILDRNGIVVARLREGVAQSGVRSTGEVIRAAAKAPEGSLGSIPTIEGDHVLSAYRRLPFGWVVGVAANPRVLDAPLARTLWAVGLLGAAALLLGFVLAAFVGCKLTRGASALLRSAQNLSGQAPVEFAQTGISEFDSVSAAFVDASARLRQRDAQRLAAENELRASEERFRLAADAVAGIIYDWEVATTRSNRSRGLFTVLGFEPEEVDSDGAWWDSRVHPDDRDGLRRSADQAVAEGRPRWEHEYRVRHRDGRWVQVLDRAAILYNSDGTPQRWVGCSIDVSEQHRIEDALRASEERFRLIADSLPQLVWTAGPDGRVDYTNANRARYGTMGMRRTDWDGVIHPDDRRGTIAAWLKSKDSGEPYEMEHRLMIAGRGFVWHLTRAVASRDSSGEIVKWYGTTIDVQDHKLREEAFAN